MRQLADEALKDGESYQGKLSELQLDHHEVMAKLAGAVKDLQSALGNSQQELEAASSGAHEAKGRLEYYESQGTLRRAWLSIRGLTVVVRTSRHPSFFIRVGLTGVSAARLKRDAAAAMAIESRAKIKRFRAAYINWVRPLLTTEINNRLRPTYRGTLPLRPGPGLAEIYTSEYEVKTFAGERLIRVLDRMPGGTIGICGLRGSGKSTLMNAICRTGKTNEGESTLGFVISAPVRYEPREFILHTFRCLCEAILGPGKSTFDPLSKKNESTVGVTSLTLVIGAFTAFAVGIIELSAGFLGTSLTKVVGYPVFNFLAGIALLTGSILLTVRIFHVTLANTEDHVESSLSLTGSNNSEIRRLAAELIAETRYQLTYTSGWSGSLSAPVAQSSISQGIQAEERQRTLPNIIAEFRDLAGKVSSISSDGSRTKLFIGIDELDKIGSPDDTANFLNDIKAIFHIESCFYLVSLSDDAMRAFERRGLPIRDIFDSTFDEIVRIESLTCEEATRLIRGRTIMPETFAALCHCLSGGLPRDLIRTARTLYSLNADRELDGRLDSIVRAVVESDLRAKTAAYIMELGQLHWNVAVPSVVHMLRILPDRAMKGEDLFLACAEIRESMGKRVNASRHGGHSRNETGETAIGARSHFGTLMTEICSYSYFAVTILQFFERQLTDKELMTAGLTQGDGSFDSLAEARLQFAQGPVLAWDIVSAFRETHGFPTLMLPEFSVETST